MVRRIQEDHKRFRNKIEGDARGRIRDLIHKGGFTKVRPDGSKIRVNITGIEQPKFVHGSSNNDGKLDRGEGKEGDVIGYEPGQGQGQGNKAGEEHAEGITIGVELDTFLKFLQDELQLPPMIPKPNQTYEDIKIRYNDISRIGADALLHRRRTLLEACKRQAATGELYEMHNLPGANVPMPLITPINSDKRFRQYQEEKIPSSNAVIFFLRDCSASMDDYRCDVVSDMCWWIDIWIKQYYERMERCYIIHDTEAEEVSKEKFYGYRQGGGTRCSSAFQLVADILENQYPPDQYNVYIFYFSDGDNWGSDDNTKIVSLAEKELGPDLVNMIGFTEVCPYSEGTLKEYLDQQFLVKNNESTRNGFEHIRTTTIGEGTYGWREIPFTEEQRGLAIVEAIKAIIGKERVYK